MNKLFIAIAIGGLFLQSCSNQNRVEAGQAEVVPTTENQNGTEYAQVKDSSFVFWRASHLGGMQKRWGRVSLADASVKVENDALTNATVLMNMGSLTVENFEDAESKAKLEGHLKIGDFFDIEHYPNTKFEMTKIEGNDGEYNSKVTGNLTIKDVTKSITFLANVDITNDAVSIQSEDFSVDRTVWGISYNTEGTSGVPVDYLIANDIGFTIDVSVARS